jgi:hypothetical protein
VTETIRRQLDLLMNAYGYNLYEKKNRARADDLIVRETAAGALGAAANSLRTLRTEYRRRYVPPPTRDNPEPSRARLDDLAEMARMQEQVADLETRVRSMSVPVQDRAWEKFRKEDRLLNELLMQDYNLIAPCQNLREMLRTVHVESWNAESVQQVETVMSQIDDAIRARQQLLQFTG